MAEREFRTTPQWPIATTPLNPEDFVEVWQGGKQRYVPYGELGGTPAAHAGSHKHDGTDEIGTLDNLAYEIPKLDADGYLNTRVSDASATNKGIVQLAADGEEDATKAVSGTDGRLKDARPPTAHASEHVAGSDVIPDATVSNSGLMSAEDKVKADATNPAYIPTEDQKAALAGSYGTPSATNKYVTESDPVLSSIGGGGGGTTGPDLLGIGEMGTGLSVIEGGPALAALNSTDVAFIGNSNRELRTYRFNGSTWSQEGTGLSINNADNPALAALNSTDVAFIDVGNRELRTYRFNGTTWSQVGDGLSISGVTGPALAALNSTDVAFIDSVNDELRVYRFNGSTWSQVGTGLSISGVSTPALAALNSTDVAFKGATNDKLRTYNFLFGYDSASVNIVADYEVPEIATGKSIVIRRTSAYDGNPVTITPPSGATFEGLASLSLYGQYSFVELERISETVFAIKDLNDNHEITPMMTFEEGSTGITYSVQVGYATVDKHRVRANGRVTITSKGTSTGRMCINLQGLPPVILLSTGVSFTCGATLCTLMSYTGQIQSYISSGTNRLYFIQSPETGSAQSFITDANLVNGSEVYFNIDYQWR